LDVVVCDTLDVTISDLFVPDLQWLATNAVEYRQEAALKCVLEHVWFVIAQDKSGALDVHTLS